MEKMCDERSIRMDLIDTLYRHVGYDVLLSDLQKVHELYKGRVPNPPSDSREEKKEVVERVRFRRAPLLEQDRCASILSRGDKCSLRRDTYSVFCVRHKAEQDRAREIDNEK